MVWSVVALALPVCVHATVPADVYLAEPDATGNYSKDCALLMNHDITSDVGIFHGCMAKPCLQKDLGQLDDPDMGARKPSVG